MSHLREATLTDVQGIATIARDVWEQDILPDVYRAHVEEDTCALWVATEHGQVAGFASAFLTVVADRRRWEIDLVAVRPASQGRGLGTRLVRRVTEAGQPYAVSLSRALIRVDNVPSQRAFESVGFTSDRRRHRLLLWSPEPADDATPYAGPVTLVPVDALTYRGLWIEDLTSVPAEEQRRAVKAARSIIAQENRLNTGALIPIDAEHPLPSDLRHQATMQGEYHWFIRPGDSERTARR